MWLGPKYEIWLKHSQSDFGKWFGHHVADSNPTQIFYISTNNNNFEYTLLVPTYSH